VNIHLENHSDALHRKLRFQNHQLEVTQNPETETIQGNSTGIATM
jgi:hypothetical protein